MTTERGRLCDYTGREWSDVATSQGMPVAPEAGRGQVWILPYSLLRGPALLTPSL